MKLITHTTRNFLTILFISLTIWGIFFYRTVKPIIYEELDEYLLSRQKEVIGTFKKNPDILNLQDLGLFNFHIEEVSEESIKNIKQGYSDVQLYVPNEHEDEPFRKLIKVFKNKGKFYKIGIVSSLVDKQQVKTLIVVSTLLLQMLLLFILLLLNRKMLKKVWKPFYKLLEEIKKYRIDKPETLKLMDTEIKEFKILNEAVKELLGKNRKAYLSQKQFIDNVSHEIKTPLAIIKNKTELLMQSSEIKEENGQLLSNIYEFTTKLNKMAESLLLLSKIENNQFANKNTISVNQLIYKLKSKYIEFAEFRNIEIEIKEFGEKFLEIDEMLGEILFKNLLLNSINHNITNGNINIMIGKNKFVIQNTGEVYEGSTSHFFERFLKSSVNPSSTGLGLAIVKSICEINNMAVDYKVEKNIHILTIKY